MLKKMCSKPPWSHVALSTVHQCPRSNTGKAPLAPNTWRATNDGENKENNPTPPMSPREASNVSAYRTTDAPMTNGTNPMSPPSARSIGAKPQSPGFRRPQL